MRKPILSLIFLTLFFATKSHSAGKDTLSDSEIHSNTMKMYTYYRCSIFSTVAKKPIESKRLFFSGLILASETYDYIHKQSKEERDRISNSVIPVISSGIAQNLEYFEDREFTLGMIYGKIKINVLENLSAGFDMNDHSPSERLAKFYAWRERIALRKYVDGNCEYIREP